MSLTSNGSSAGLWSSRPFGKPGRGSRSNRPASSSIHLHQEGGTRGWEEGREPSVSPIRMAVGAGYGVIMRRMHMVLMEGWHGVMVSQSARTSRWSNHAHLDIVQQLVSAKRSPKPVGILAVLLYLITAFLKIKSILFH